MSSFRPLAGARSLLLVSSVAFGIGWATTPAVSQSGGAIEAAIAKSIELEQRVILLEDQVRKMQEHLVVNGTLEVRDPGGKPMLTVYSDGSGARVVVGGGPQEITLTSAQEAAVEIGLPGLPSVKLFASDERAELALGREDGTQARLYQLGEAGELKLETGDGQTARMTQDATGSEVYLGSDDARNVRMVLRPETSEIAVGKLDGNEVRLSESGGNAQVTLGAAGAAVLTLAAVGEGGTVTLGKAGGPVILLKQEGGEGKLTMGPAGAPELTLGQSQQGGQLLMGAGATPKLRLATNDIGGELQLGQPDGLRVQLGTRGADAVVQVANGDDHVSLSSGGEVNGLLARTEEGAVIVGAAGGNWGVRLSKDNQAVALLGTQGSEPPALNLFGEGSEPMVVLQGEGQGGKLRMGTGGKDAPVSLGSTGDSNFLYLGREGTRHIELLAESDEASLTAVDGEKYARVYVNGTDVAVMARNTEMSSELGQVNANWGLNIFEKGGPIVAGLGDVAGRGVALRLYENSQAVGAFGASPDGSGGTLWVYSGGNPTVNLGAIGGSGVVTVFDSGGAPVLAMSGPDPAFAVYNSGGIPVAHLGYGSSGGGNVTAADDGGVNVFSAGAASDGGGEVCVVRENNKGACLGIGLPGMGTGQ